MSFNQHKIVDTHNSSVVLHLWNNSRGFVEIYLRDNYSCDAISFNLAKEDIPRLIEFLQEQIE